MPNPTIKRRSVPALLGRREAAEYLHVASSNLARDFPELPPPLQDRGIPGFAVVATPLWPKAELSALRAGRTIKRVEVPPLVGRAEAAMLLGVASRNLERNFSELPRPLQDRPRCAVRVRATPLWPLAEILDLKRHRERAKAA